MHDEMEKIVKTDDVTREMPVIDPKTAEIPAANLRTGNRVWYEPSEIAGRGYAALVVDKVETSDEGRVTVNLGDAQVTAIIISSDPKLPPLPLEITDRVDLPWTFSFGRDDLVTVIVEDAEP